MSQSDNHMCRRSSIRPLRKWQMRDHLLGQADCAHHHGSITLARQRAMRLAPSLKHARAEERGASARPITWPFHAVPTFQCVPHPLRSASAASPLRHSTTNNKCLAAHERSAVPNITCEIEQRTHHKRIHHLSLFHNTLQGHSGEKRRLLCPELDTQHSRVRHFHTGGGARKVSFFASCKKIERLHDVKRGPSLQCEYDKYVSDVRKRFSAI